MRYYYYSEFDEFMQWDDMAELHHELKTADVVQADNTGEFIKECIESGELIEISKDVYDNMYLFWETREKIRTHIATYHADWDVCITADGQHFGLTLEGEFLCGMDLEDVIPALDYLYSVIDATSTVEDDVQALDRMIDTWGL